MIVEFYGLPGTGKTTTMKQLLTYGNPISEMPHGKEKSNLYHLLHILTPEFLHFTWLVFRLWMKAQHKDRRNCFLLMRLYLIDMQIRNESKDNSYYYCTDHGLVQTLSSIVWQEKQLVSELIPVYHHLARYFSGEIVFVYVYSTKLHEVYERIQIRNEKRRIKEMAEEDAINLLKLEKDLFDSAEIYLKNGCSVISINGGNSVNMNAQIIYEWLTYHMIHGNGASYEK